LLKPLQEWGRGLKENDVGVNLNMYTVRTFVNVTMYPQYNNMIIKNKILKKLISPRTFSTC
jgi:hypothetical protein